MPTVKSYLLLIFLFWGSAVSLFAQQCPASITPVGPPPVCQGENVVLRANKDPALTYQWQRNGVDIPGATADSLQAAESGDYTVRVSGPTCTATTSIPVTVTVNPLPAQPDFQPNPNTPQCSGSPIAFTITNPQAGESYVWDFGDGTTGVGNSVSHTYQQTGGGTVNFEVKVYSVGPSGCRSAIRTQLVAVKQTPQFSAPTDSAGFKTCIPDSVSADSIQVRAVLYNTTVSNDIASYLVDFGDGSGEQTFLPEQFTATTPIRNPIPYDTTGSFPIRIRAVGRNGCETVFTKQYQINKKPEANFSAQKDRVTPTVPPKDCIPVRVTVADSTKGGNVTYKWSVKNNTGQDAGAGIFAFIEGTNDTSASPIMRFDVSGRYNLQLIVTNSCGSDTTSQSLLIGYPEVRLQADTTSCGPTVINFSDALVQIDPNLGTIIEESIEWKVTGTGGAVFVNGTTAKSRNPQISFPNTGTYEVTLRVSNECGFSDVVEQQGAIARVTVNPIPAAPVITGTGVTICSGDTTQIRPTGPGSNFAFYNVQTGGSPLFTGRAYNPGPLTTTTTYYVSTRDANNCESTTRRAFTVTVVPAIANNTISQSQDQREVCSGQTLPRPLTGSVPTGGNGAPLYTWQSSQTGNPGDFTAAPGTNNGRDYTPPAMTSTTYFRRLVTIGDCRPDTSNVVMIQVNPPITDNTINVTGGSAPVICEGQAAPEIVGSQPGSTAVIVYESSTTGANATDFTPAAGLNNAANYAPGVLERTTWFRRRITSGGCTSVSPAVEITVTPAVFNNTITGEQTVCSATTTLQPLTGSMPQGGSGTLVYLWEMSLTGNDADFRPAPGTNNRSDYTPSAIRQTTWFRRSITSGSCEPLISNEVAITFVPQMENNTITADQTNVCEGTLPTVRGTEGGSAYVALWEISTTSATTGFFPAPGKNNGQNYTPTDLTQTTWFRRSVRPASTDCPLMPSNVVMITVTPQVSNNTITGEQTICSQATRPQTLNGSVPRGGSGTLVYLWEMSLTGNDADFRPAPGTNNQSDYTPQAIRQTTWFRRSVTSGSCGPLISNAVKLTFVPELADNTITVAQATVCEGSLPTIQGSDGGPGFVALWEMSTTSATAGFNPAPGINNGRNYTPPALTRNAWFRRSVRPANTDCPPTPSNVVLITVEPLPAAPTVAAADVQVCQGSPATLRASGNGATFAWYTSPTLGSPVFYGPEFVTPRMTGNATFYVEAISQNQCASSTRTPVRVTVTPVFADAGRDTTIIEGQGFALRARGGTQFQWSPAAGLSDAAVANPIARPTKTTTYQVTVSNELGCQATDEVTITVIPRVRVVNTFSPNQDGVNETWEIEHIENYPNATVEVFNRWGNPVYKSSGPYQPWDGTFKGSPLPLATYYYIIRLDKDEKPISGSVTIIR